MDLTQPLLPQETMPILSLLKARSLYLLCLLLPIYIQAGETVGPSTSNGWGLNAHNHRYIRADQTNVNRQNVERLALKWTVRLDTGAPRSYPHLTESHIYLGSGSSILALERETGEVLWTTTTEGNVTTAIVREGFSGSKLYYGADTAEVGAVDIQSGEKLWSSEIDDAHTPRYSGSPLVADNKVFVPVSSYEIGLTLVPFYGCCRSSGGMAALDTQNGEVLWYRPTIERAEHVGYGFLLTRQFAPSGAPVWSAPTYDEKRDRVYFATGQNYSRPTSETSDAIFAVDADSGEVAWVYQATSNDAYTLACNLGEWMPNCFAPMGPDVDFGGPPVLATTEEGRELLFAGQKSGDVHALDPDDGSLVWKTNVGRGGLLGGVHFGLAVHPELHLVLAPVSDKLTSAEELKRVAKPGVHALNMSTGEVVWSHLIEAECPQNHCWPGVSANLVVTPDLIFGGTLSGRLFSLDAESGELLWEFKTVRPFETTDGKGAHGGSIDAHGPMVDGDNLFISSGYGAFSQMAGNAFLNFELTDE